MRKIIVVLAVLLAQGLDAQIYIDSYRFAQPPAANLLLDDYPGAAAAYSLRKLDKDYTGNAIEIRRSNDNATAVIGFDANGNLDVTAIASHCTTNTCYVTTWYDQSGNGNNATQVTPANQPTIYTSGAVVSINSKPAINFVQASVNFLSSGANTITKSTSNTAFNVLQRSNNATSKYGFAYGFGPDRNYTYQNSTTLTIASGNVYNSTTSIGSQILETINYSASSYYYRNGSLVSTGNLTVASGNFNYAIGVIAGGTTSNANFMFNGFMQELIYYPTNQSTNRTNIESNINSYYSIY